MDTSINLGKEKLGKLFLQYTVPSVISMIIFSIYIVIDGIFVGQAIGGDGLAAINIAMPFFSVAMAISIMVSAGTNTIIGIELGQGELKQASKTFSLGFYSLMVISLSMALITFIFLDPIAILLGASEKLMPMVKQYLLVLCIGVPVFTGGGLLGNAIRTMGRPNYSMACSLLGSILNIILDYIFIIKWDMGVLGAGLASTVAFFISFFVALIPYFKANSVLKFTSCEINFKKIGRFFYNGSSEALVEIAVAFSTYIFNIVLMMRVGEIGVSAFSIISYITSLLVAVILGISGGVSPIISYNYGAGEVKRIRGITNLSIKVIIVIGVICTIGMNFFAESLITLFTQGDTELIATTVWATKIYSLAFLINGINILASAYFTALEDAAKSALISVLRGIVFIVVGITILPPVLGDAGIWLTVAFSEVLTLGVTIWYMRRSYAVKLKENTQDLYIEDVELEDN